MATCGQPYQLVNPVALAYRDQDHLHQLCRDQLRHSADRDKLSRHVAFHAVASSDIFPLQWPSDIKLTLEKMLLRGKGPG